MIVLVDLGAVFWRNYFATKSDIDAYELTVDKVREHREAYHRTIVCCDSAPTRRLALFPEYKANRDEKPREALDSLRACEQQFESWGLPVVRAAGYEADDLIATFVAQAGEDNVRIMSHDKDLYALISERICLVKPDGRIIDDYECKKKFGVGPSQMLDFLALVGDASDNVPGCPGTGPGRARDLLQRFGSLAKVLAATDDELRAVRGVGEKTVAGLRGWNPELALSLIALEHDAPVNLYELLAEPEPEPGEFSIQW